MDKCTSDLNLLYNKEWLQVFYNYYDKEKYARKYKYASSPYQVEPDGDMSFQHQMHSH